MQPIIKEMERDRLFVSDRIWALFSTLVAFYGRTAMLVTLSFKDRQLKDWRDDEMLDGHLRSVFSSKTIHGLNMRSQGALSQVIAELESAFRSEVRNVQT
jgi:hypothetical protein